ELVASGYLQEETIDLNKSEDSRFLKTGDDGEYYIKTVGYTGWKIVGVVQNEGISLNNFKSGLLIAFLVLFFLSVIAIVNMHLSKRLSAPMKRLEEAVNKIEAGDLDTHIEPSGFYEVWHLGRAISDMQANLKQLMDDIVAEHEAKRRSELMVLQNQINPHFLYNTLDIIVWMIENEKREEAVDVVTALARFFRISLSNGKTAISVMDEVEHVRNYLMIQEMRYKNKFTYTFDVEDGLEKYGTIKLILQPVVENCIYHAMEFMDGDGEIRITVKKDGETILFSVMDNGCGMTEDIVERIMAGEKVSKGKGGVGLQNVQERLQLVFGNEYGMTISSEPDEGTEVLIRIPAVSWVELAERGLDKA
ncbi:MAG: sensor histidine kinase, partial [Anaerotignum sp.]|nr:sensor histidine kinase [Anaerotignum sp.]